MDFGLQGKSALVCASSKGLGKAIALGLAKEGVSIILTGRNPETLAHAQQEVSAVTAQPVHRLAGDLSIASDREYLLTQVLDWFPQGVDILIHNVGGPPPSTVLGTDMTAWQKAFEQNFMSIAHLNQVLLPKMQAKRWGRVLAITSIAVVQPQPSLPVSTAIRAGVTGLLKALATEVASDGVTVNCLAPGYIGTDRLSQLMQQRAESTQHNYEMVLEEALKPIPMGRFGTPEEFASLAVYLCSEQAAYITGSTIAVDGGMRKSLF